MTDADFPLDGSFPLDPSPDEDAWATYVEYALAQMGGNPNNGITNTQLAELEGLVGTPLPFELGLLLVIGVPDGGKWWRWDSDPAETLAGWKQQISGGVLFDVEHNDTWLESWGSRPEALADRVGVVSELIAAAPPLLPIFGHRCMPLTLAHGEQATEANPIFSIVQTDMIVYGEDLAVWFNKQFEVPLPAWPETAPRTFDFWSGLIEAN